MKNRYLVKQFAAAILLGGAMLVSGCASIVHGQSEKFSVDTQPESAVVTVDNTVVGKTPTQLTLTRNENHTIRFDLPGYDPATIRLDRTLSGWAFGNIIFGGLIGIVIDAADGAIYKLTPEQINQYATQSGIQYNDKTQSIMVFMARHSSRHWQKIGQLRKA